MKKILLACTLLGSIGAAYAQPAAHGAHDNGPASAAERAAHMQKALQLSDEQTVKVKKVYESSEQDRKALFDKYKPQFEAYRGDMKKQRDQTKTQLNAVLTPTQQAALETMHEGRGKGIRAHRKHGNQCPMHGDDGGKAAHH